jgi:DNA-binding transcriptional regulator YhcF (GntR family)
MSMRRLPPISAESRLPKQLQVKAILAGAIATGLFPPGSRMPDSRQIAEEVNAGLATTRRAILSLIGERWLERDGFGHTILSRIAHQRASAVCGGDRETSIHVRESVAVGAQAVSGIVGWAGGDDPPRLDGPTSQVDE